MTRSRSTSGRAGLVLALLLGAAGPALAQEPAGSSTSTATLFVVLMVGIALGIIIMRWLGRRMANETRRQRDQAGRRSTSDWEKATQLPRRAEQNGADGAVKPASSPAVAPANATPAAKEPRPKGQNVYQKLQEQAKQTTPPAQKKSAPRQGAKSSSPEKNPAAPSPNQLPKAVAQQEPASTESPDAALPAGETIEMSVQPQATQSLEDSAPEAAPVAPNNGPLHFYAPAPDVPSIEHRKLSPNPLPQMPLLITLPHSEATTAQFSFSPQADQSRIIGNGVRELKEFFQFELPPTEQFTTIKNLAAGKLEKRDDAWHVVQKAGIALS